MLLLSPGPVVRGLMPLLLPLRARDRVRLPQRKGGIRMTQFTHMIALALMSYGLYFASNIVYSNVNNMRVDSLSGSTSGCWAWG